MSQPAGLAPVAGACPPFYSIPLIHLPLPWEHSSLQQRFYLRNMERCYSNSLDFISIHSKHGNKEEGVDISNSPEVERAEEWGLQRDTVVLSEWQTFL